jgi:hypothetical protein
LEKSVVAEGWKFSLCVLKFVGISNRDRIQGNRTIFEFKYDPKKIMARVRERIIPTEQPRLIGDVSAKFADRGCHLVSVTDPYGRIFGFLGRSRYLFLPVAPQLYSRGHYFLENLAAL